MSDNTLDLDAARAARDDADKKPLPVTLGGERFRAIRPLPIRAIIAAEEGDLDVLVRALFGEDADKVLDMGIDEEDLRLVLRELVGGSGNSDASSG